MREKWHIWTASEVIAMYNQKLMQQRLKNLRKQKGCTLQIAAERIGIGQRTLWTVENGESTPNLDTIDAIADFYGVSLDWLCGRTEKNPAPAATGNGTM